MKQASSKGGLESTQTSTRSSPTADILKGSDDQRRASSRRGRRTELEYLARIEGKTATELARA